MSLVEVFQLLAYFSGALVRFRVSRERLYQLRHLCRCAGAARPRWWSELTRYCDIRTCEFAVRITLLIGYYVKLCVRGNPSANEGFAICKVPFLGMYHVIYNDGFSGVCCRKFC